MEFDLDSGSLIVLKEVFDWTDYDGDGVISKNDLKLSSGLQSDSEVNLIFTSLLSSTEQGKEYITLEEFSKGIMDFPHLLEQFKKECTSKPLEIKIVEYSDEEQESSFKPHKRNDSMQFINKGLFDSIIIYSKILGTDPKVSQYDHREDMLEVLRALLEKIRYKYKNEDDVNKLLTNASVELYLLIRDISRYCEEIVSDFNAEINENLMNIEELKLNYSKVVGQNKILEDRIIFFEKKNIVTKEERSEIAQKNESLQRKLVVAENKELDYVKELEYIQEVIDNKGKQIALLEKELRQLNSFKTIKEMRATTDKKSINLKKAISNRNTLNYEQKSPRSKPKSPQNNFKLEIMSRKLKQTNELYKETSDQLVRTEMAVEVYKDKMEELENLNHRLMEKVRHFEFEVSRSSNPTAQSVDVPNLYEELNCLTIGDERISKVSVLPDIFIEKFDKASQTKIETLNAGSQSFFSNSNYRNKNKGIGCGCC